MSFETVFSQYQIDDSKIHFRVIVQPCDCVTVDKLQNFQ